MIDVYKVADENDFSWIKVKRYEQDSNKSAVEELASLEAHHIAETEFLLNTCRALAKQIVENNNKFFWGFEVKDD